MENIFNEFISSWGAFLAHPVYDIYLFEMVLCKRKNCNNSTLDLWAIKYPDYSMTNYSIQNAIHGGYGMTVYHDSTAIY